MITTANWTVKPLKTVLWAPALDIPQGPCNALGGMPESPGKRPPEARQKGLQFVSLGFEMVVPIVLLMYVGYRLDAWLGSKPWLFLVGALLGIAVGFYGMFKRVGILGNRGEDE